jgi:cytochrome P450
VLRRYGRAMTESMIRTYAGVRAVLADSRFGVPEAGPSGEPGTLCWLRATVSRFVNGPVHERRRRLVTAELGHLEPAQLRRQAYGLARAETDKPVGALAGRLPTAVLARALGVAEPDVPDAVTAVSALAPAYLHGAGDADAAVATLCRLLGPAPSERLAARISILAQAHLPTAAWIMKVVAAGRGTAPFDEVLRQDPPVRETRRVAYQSMQFAGADLAAGDLLVLDLAAAGSNAGDPPLAFGTGCRPCPGAAYARALAEGVVEAVTG